MIAFDPLDGSSNIDVNVLVGSIFSVLPAPNKHAPIQDSDFLVPGSHHVASSYVILGHATELVISTGKGVHAFTLDTKSNNWCQTRGQMLISKQATEFAINTANHRHWDPRIQTYLSELVAGEAGPRKKDFNMRWVASMVADAHRILYRGGFSFIWQTEGKRISKANLG